MTMLCPRCAAPSRIVATKSDGRLHTVSNDRVCENNHRFSTREVHPTMVADEREFRSAVQRIIHRTALWWRDKAIFEDPRSHNEVAALHNLTPTRVRQIRASLQEALDAPASRKILSSTQKGK